MEAQVPCLSSRDEDSLGHVTNIDCDRKNDGDEIIGEAPDGCAVPRGTMNCEPDETDTSSRLTHDTSQCYSTPSAAVGKLTAQQKFAGLKARIIAKGKPVNIG